MGIADKMLKAHDGVKRAKWKWLRAKESEGGYSGDGPDDSQEKEPDVHVAYLCRGDLPCGASDNCCYNGGYCMLTQDVRHAKNFFRTGPTSPYYSEEVR